MPCATPLIELVESSASICVHILRKLARLNVEGYPNCFLQMGRLGLIPQRLAESLAAAARLRNLLVHRYWEVDDRRLYDAARSGLRVFLEYASLVEERWMS